MLVEIEKENDGRWIAEIDALPGVLSYGDTREEAIAKAKALALRVMADRLDPLQGFVTGPFERPSCKAS